MKFEDLMKQILAANSAWDLSRIDFNQAKQAIADFQMRFEALEATVKAMNTPATPAPAQP